MSWTDDIAYLLQNIVITYYLLFMFLFHVLRRKQQITEYWNIETFGSFSQGQGMLAWGLLSGNKIGPTVFRPSRHCLALYTFLLWPTLAYLSTSANVHPNVGH